MIGFESRERAKNHLGAGGSYWCTATLSSAREQREHHSTRTRFRGAGQTSLLRSRLPARRCEPGEVGSHRARCRLVDPRQARARPVGMTTVCQRGSPAVQRQAKQPAGVGRLAFKAVEHEIAQAVEDELPR